MKKTLTIKTKFHLGDIVTTKRHTGCSLIVYSIKIDYDNVLTYTVWDAADNTYENYFGWQLRASKADDKFTTNE